MSTLFLLLIWLVLGLLSGLLALAAHLKPATWQKRGLLRLLLTATGAALLGGLLGFWLLGRLFSPASALWLSILASCAPGIYAALRKRLAFLP